MSIYVNKVKRLFKNDPFSELLPVIEYWDDEKLFVCEGPSIGAMLICSPTIGGNSKIQNALESMYKQSFPENSTIQFSLVSTPDIEDMLYGYDAIRGGRIVGPDQEKVDLMSSSIRDFYREGSQHPINRSGFQFRDFEVWVTIKIPIKEALPTEKEIKTFRNLVEQTYTLLEMLGPYEATETDYHRRMQVLMNMYDGVGWRGIPRHHHKIKSSRPLRETILPPNKRIVPKKNGVAFYDEYDNELQFVKTLGVSAVKDELWYGEMLNLIGDWRYGQGGLYEHYMLTLNVVLPHQRKAKNALQAKRNFVTQQARGSVLQWLERLKFQKQDLDRINREIENEGSSLVDYAIQITIFGKTEKHAEDFAKKMIGFYAAQQITLKQDAYFTMPFFLASLPFGLSDEFVKGSSRFERATSKAMPFLTPHMGSWKGNTLQPSILLTSRLGQLVSLDFFQSETNYNVFCAATSGAGKSFMAGYLINSYLGSGIKQQPNDKDNQVNFDDGSRCYIVDVGRSYEALAKQYHGAQFIDFSKDTKYSLNPFASITQMEGVDGQASMVLTIIKLMASPTGRINDLQNAGMQRLMMELWHQKGHEATITDFANMCLQDEEKEIRNIGKQLVNFTEGYQYGDMFSNKYPPVNYDSRLIVCELQNLKSDPHLQVVALMSIIMSIQRAMFMSGTDKRKLFLLDEAWQFISDEGMMKFFADFLENGYRTFRKFNSLGCTITQSLGDAYQSSAGRAIIANSAWLMLMRQDDEAIDRLKSEKQYSGAEIDFDLMKSLKTQKPKPGIKDPDVYSEVFLRHGTITQVCRLYTDRKLQLILSTDPDEKARRSALMEKGMSLNEAIEHMLAEEGYIDKAS